MSDAPVIPWPPAPTDLASARAMMSFAADAGLRGEINEKQVTACVKACDSFVRAERFVEQLRTLTKEVERLKRTMPKPST